MNRILIFVVFLLVTSIVFVDAIGSSTNNIEVDSADNNIDDVNKLDENYELGLDKAINAFSERSKMEQEILEKLQECHNIDDRTERIECRLKIRNREEVKYKNSKTTLPEACKNLNNRENCRRLYNVVSHCYEFKDGREKSRCFRKIAGFIKANVENERENKQEKTRNYLVFLLYELQKKIEKKSDNGEIKAERAAIAIEKIVVIKEDIFNGKSKNDIKPKLQELKTIIRGLKV